MNSQVTLKDRVAEKLGIPNVSDWGIGDSAKNGLVLINVSESADLATYGHLHGAILDMDVQPVNDVVPMVSQSYGYEPVVVADRIQINNGQLNLVDNAGQQYSYDVGFRGTPTLMLKQGQEGVFVRVFMFPDYTIDQVTDKIVVSPKMHIATRRRLNAEGRYGSHDNPTFEEMYHMYNGPTLEQLYDTTKMYSPYVHSFLIVHPSLQHVCKDDVRDGYMMYLGANVMWDLDFCPYDPSLVDWNILQPSSVSQDIEMVKQNPSALMYYQPPLSVEEANLHLRYGYSPQSLTENAADSRLGLGEFVIMALLQDGVLLKQFRVYSPAYAWRSRIRDDNPNLRHQFYKLFTDALGFYGNNREFVTKQQNQNFYLRSFLDKYPIINHDVDAIVNLLKEGLPLVNVERVNNIEVIRSLIFGGNPRDSISACLKFIWTCLILAVPFREQAQLAYYYDEFLNSRDVLISWVRDLAKIDDYQKFFQGDDDRNFVRIINAAQTSAMNEVNRSQSINEPLPDMEELVGTGISNLLMKERGPSMYQMQKIMYRVVEPDQEDYTGEQF